MDTEFDKQRYQEGKAQAGAWASSGGRLDRDPPASDEAFENGYADRLHELQLAQQLALASA